MQRLLFVILLGPAVAHGERSADIERSVDADKELVLAAGLSASTNTDAGMMMAGGSDDEEPVLLAGFRLRISERIVWAIPTLSFAYLGGESGSTRWIPWAGATSFGIGYSSIEGFITQATIGAGIGVRHPLTEAIAINATASTHSGLRYASANRMCQPAVCDRWLPPSTWMAGASLGLSQRIGDRVSLNAGVAVSATLIDDGDADASAPRVSFGSVQNLALRSLPLVQVGLGDHWSAEGFAAFELARGADSRVSALLGASRIW